jgi:hypothetical protein
MRVGARHPCITDKESGRAMNTCRAAVVIDDIDASSDAANVKWPPGKATRGR